MWPLSLLCVSVLRAAFMLRFLDCTDASESSCWILTTRRRMIQYRHAGSLVALCACGFLSSFQHHRHKLFDDILCTAADRARGTDDTLKQEPSRASSTRTPHAEMTSMTATWSVKLRRIATWYTGVEMLCVTGKKVVCACMKREESNGREWSWRTGSVGTGTNTGIHWRRHHLLWT